MAYRVMQEVGGATKVNLSKSGKAMLIYHILEKQKKELTFLGKSEENIDIIETAITEFKKHHITLEELKQVTQNTKDPYLKTKLVDLSKLYQAYEQAIQNQYIDQEDTLTILMSQLPKTNMFQDCNIYLDEFVGFTKQEQEIIRQLLKVAKQVNVTITTDTLRPQEQRETDLFYANKQTALTLLDIARQEYIEIEQDVILEKTMRFKHPELQQLEKNIYATKTVKYENTIEQIQLFLAMNPFSELEKVAQEIVTLVRQEGYQYKEIAIIARNLDTYSNLIKAIFKEYEIPVFLDEKKELSQNILVKHVLAITSIFAKNWSYEAMFNYIKNGLCPIEQEDIFLLENYCIKWGIRGNKWYKQEWSLADSNEELEKVETLRKTIVEPLLNFKNKLTNTKTVEDISKALYEFLIDNQVDKRLEEKIEQLEQMQELEIAKEYQLSWDTLMNVLDEIVLVLKEDTISFQDYVKVLKVGLQHSGLGKIPATCDQVLVGDVERSKTHQVRAVFMVGLNDGVFPSVHKEEGYLNDADREYLKQNGVELAKGTLEALYEDNFNTYKAFTIAEEKLYLSYISSDISGKSLRPSMLIPKLKKLFPNLKETSDVTQESAEITTKQATFSTLLHQIRNYQEKGEISSVWLYLYSLYAKDSQWKDKLETAVKGLEYSNEPVRLKKEIIQQLYPDTVQTSISRLEQYKKCEFSYFLTYGLQLSDKREFKIESLDTGSFMHDVIDNFFDQVCQRNLILKEMTKQQIEEIVENIINEKLSLTRNYIFTSTAKYQLLTKRLKKVILTSMQYIIQSLTDSDFEIFGNEVEFNKQAQYPPITITLDNGKKIELTGKIDRIDLAKNEKGNYIRIIDYKSSVKNIELNEVVAGLQLQLLTYLDAVMQHVEDAIPAGILYFNLLDPMIKATKNKTEEEIEQEIKKKFKMQGLILADVNVVKMMDKKLDKGASDIVPAYIDATQHLSPKLSNAITKEQFQDLQRYTNTLIKEIAKEILTGSIRLKPYYNMKNKKTPCQYCSYRSICNFTTHTNEYQYINATDKQTLLEQIKKES